MLDCPDFLLLRMCGPEDLGGLALLRRPASGSYPGGRRQGQKDPSYLVWSHSFHLASRAWSWNLHPDYLCTLHTWLFNPFNKPCPSPSPGLLSHLTRRPPTFLAGSRDWFRERWGEVVQAVWGAADDASLACLLLTSCAAARFMAGLGPVPVYSPGLGAPALTRLLFQSCCWSVLAAEPAQLGLITGVGWT